MSTLVFAECEKLINASRFRDDKKLEGNTHLCRIDEDTFGVKLYDTYVVKIHRNGNYTLSTGGFKTKLTKDRISSYSPVQIRQSKNVWYLNDKQPFEDGCVVDSNGVLV